jgi:hypothetical protein
MGTREEIIDKFGIYEYLNSFKEYSERFLDPVENFHVGKNKAIIARVLPSQTGHTRPDAPFTVLYGYKGFQSEVLTGPIGQNPINELKEKNNILLRVNQHA